MPVAREVWLTPYLNTQQTYDAMINSALVSSANSAAAAVRRLAGKDGIGAIVRAAQITQAQTELHKVLAQIFQRIGDLVRAGQHAAAVQALSAGFSWDETLLKRVFTSPAERAAMERALVGAAPFNVEALIIRLRHGGLPLSTQVYKTQALAQGWVTKAINDALGRGANWSELANDVKKFIDPRTQGGVSFAAQRLARTEINNAYHAVAAENMQGKPWVRAVNWELSKSHPQLDVCDALHRGGPYTPDAIPPKPHPQCFCYIVPELLSVEQFLREYRNGQYDAYMQAQYHIAA